MSSTLGRPTRTAAQTPVRGIAPATNRRAQTAESLRVAYLMSRFPKITETFILFEMKALESQGVQVEVYPLWRENTRIMHEEARSYTERAHFRRLFSWRVLQANLGFLAKRPGAYVSALLTGLRANWGSPRYFCGFLAAFPTAVCFAREMLREGITHVHAHFASHPAAAAWVIHQLTGISYSFTAHGSDLHRDVHMLREKVADAAFVVAISQYNRRVILQVCGASAEDKVRVIHCGTDTEVFRFTPDRPYTRTDQVCRIACVGTLHEVKGQHYLLDACQALHERGIAFELHLIGDGPDEKSLREKAARYGLIDRIIFHGRCTRDQIASLLEQMDVVATPSVPTRDGRREGIPVALMEAMASGAAVVASDLSGIPELVRDDVNGLLVPPGDVPAIASALERLATDPEIRARLGRAARETVEKEFDLQHNARCLAEHIQAICTRSVVPNEVRQ